MANHVGDKVFVNYAAQKVNSRCGQVQWRDSSHAKVFCVGPTLYSYGYHFPLANLVGTECPGTDKEKHVFVKNGDRYSVTTAGHQSATQHACDGPTVSASALSAAGIAFMSLRLPTKGKVVGRTSDDPLGAVIVAWRPDSRQYIVWNKKTKKYYEDHYLSKRRKVFVPPDQGQFIAHSEHEDGTMWGCWHILGACVIEQGGNYYLCSLDARSYFVSQLPKKVKTVEAAFELLKPTVVRKAEAAGKQVLRQGEWFFVPTGLDDRAMAEKFSLTQKALAAVSKVGNLPAQRPDSNLHQCKLCNDGKVSYARGKVFHRDSSGGHLTGEHHTLSLGNQWHEVYRNTEIQSWTVNGRFD